MILYLQDYGDSAEWLYTISDFDANATAANVHYAARSSLQRIYTKPNVPA